VITPRSGAGLSPVRLVSLLSAALVVALTGITQATPDPLTLRITPRLVAAPVSPGPRPAPPVTVPPRLLVLGDSVAAAAACDCSGFGADLAAQVSAVLSNAAQPGLTSSGLLAQVNSPAMAPLLQTADIVTITIGANDFDYRLASDASCATLNCYAPTLQQMTADLYAVTARLAALMRPGTTVVLTGYWNVFLDGAVGAERGPTYVAISDALTRQVNAALAQVARSDQDVYADLYTPFKDDGSADDTDLLAPDGDHPNATGHHLIAAAIANAAHLAQLARNTSRSATAADRLSDR
jgi:lysophospholipase L1-like esterase